MSSPNATLPLQARVEAQGHLIDSHIMEQIFDSVVEHGGRFEVEQFRIGRTNSEPSNLRLKIEAPDAESMQRMLSQLLGLGCSMGIRATPNSAPWNAIVVPPCSGTINEQG